METTLKKRRNSLLAAAPIIFLAAGSGGLSENALAQALPADDQARQIQLLRQQMDALTKKLDELSARQARSSAEAGLALDPGFTIRRYDSDCFFLSDNPAWLSRRERFYEAMRLAGVPEG